MSGTHIGGNCPTFRGCTEPSPSWCTLLCRVLKTREGRLLMLNEWLDMNCPYSSKFPFQSPVWYLDSLLSGPILDNRSHVNGIYHPPTAFSI